MAGSQWTYTGRLLPDGRWEARAECASALLSERHPDRAAAEAMLRRTVAAYEALRS